MFGKPVRVSQVTVPDSASLLQALEEKRNPTHTYRLRASCRLKVMVQKGISCVGLVNISIYCSAMLPVPYGSLRFNQTDVKGKLVGNISASDMRVQLQLYPSSRTPYILPPPHDHEGA